MIGQGAHVGAVNSEGDTPLDIAEEEAMEELLQNEVNRQGKIKSNLNGKNVLERIWYFSSKNIY